MGEVWRIESDDPQESKGSLARLGSALKQEGGKPRQRKEVGFAEGGGLGDQKAESEGNGSEPDAAPADARPPEVSPETTGRWASPFHSLVGSGQPAASSRPLKAAPTEENDEDYYEAGPYEAVARVMSAKDHYQAIGAKAHDLDTREVRQCYVLACVKVHPDRNHHPEAAKALTYLAEVWYVLGNDRRRANYDAALRTGRPPDEEDRMEFSVEEAYNSFADATADACAAASQHRVGTFAEVLLEAEELVHLRHGAGQKQQQPSSPNGTLGGGTLFRLFDDGSGAPSAPGGQLQRQGSGGGGSGRESGSVTPREELQPPPWSRKQQAQQQQQQQAPPSSARGAQPPPPRHEVPGEQSPWATLEPAATEDTLDQDPFLTELPPAPGGSGSEAGPHHGAPARRSCAQDVVAKVPAMHASLRSGYMAAQDTLDTSRSKVHQGARRCGESLATPGNAFGEWSLWATRQAERFLDSVGFTAPPLHKEGPDFVRGDRVLGFEPTKGKGGDWDLAGPGGFKIGDKARLQFLRVNPQANGQVCRVVGHDESTGRYRVRLEDEAIRTPEGPSAGLGERQWDRGGAVKLVHADNLALMHPWDAATA